MKGDRIPFHCLQIGDKIFLRYQKENPNNKTYHVRGFVDGRIILAYWSFSVKSYRYACRNIILVGTILRIL